MSLNKVMFIGHAGRDAELRYTQSGEPVCSFSIASTEKWKSADGTPSERTEWLRCTAWGSLAEVCAKWITKGKQVFVEGRLQTRKWQDKDGSDKYTTEAVISNMRLLGGRSDGDDRDHGDSRERDQARSPSRQQQRPAAQGQGRAASTAGGSGFNDLEDDIPF